MMIKKTLSLLAITALFLTMPFFPMMANATEYFVIYGRGSGHGVGMCLAGAKGMAETGYTYRDILRKYYSSVSFSYTSESQSIRAGLYSTTSTITISGSKGLEVFDGLENKLWAGTDGQSTTISYKEGIYSIITPSGTIESNSSYIKVVPTSSSILSLTNFSSPNKFRGNIEVRFSSSSNLLWAIND